MRAPLQHYDYTYVVPGERFPRRRPTTDPVDRDVRPSPHASIPGSAFTGSATSSTPRPTPSANAPFDMRSVMRAVADVDSNPLGMARLAGRRHLDRLGTRRSAAYRGACSASESHTVPRRGFVLSYGPPAWTSGTLFPRVHARRRGQSQPAATVRSWCSPISRLDGSPESMRNWPVGVWRGDRSRGHELQGAPIVFVVVSRYHGGAFVVFSKALTETMEIAAVEGSFALPSSVALRQPRDGWLRPPSQRFYRGLTSGFRRPRPQPARPAPEALGPRDLADQRQVRSKLRGVADEFDGSTRSRQARVGSVDTIIKAADIRPTSSMPSNAG